MLYRQNVIGLKAISDFTAIKSSYIQILMYYVPI